MNDMFLAFFLCWLLFVVPSFAVVVVVVVVVVVTAHLMNHTMNVNESKYRKM